MKIICVIGGIGAGKSTVTRTLASLGAPVIDLDVLGHEALGMKVVIEELCAAFGDDILTATGDIDRRLLACRAFSDAEKTATLSNITQPRIAELFRKNIDALERDGAKTCVFEASAFRERSQEMICDADLVVAVIAPEEIRIERAVQRGMNRDDATARMKAQPSEREYVSSADMVFTNDEDPDKLAEAVRAWWNEQGL